MDKISIDELKLENKHFRNSYIALSYPNGYDAEEDVSISDYAKEFTNEDDIEYWDEFTGYYDGVFDEYDGYLEEPTYVETQIDADRLLKIEFHPGDILYYINGEEVGCTGPHWKLNVFWFEEVQGLLNRDNGDVLFLLLLPLARINVEEKLKTTEIVGDKLNALFDEKMCGKLARCMNGISRYKNL